MFKTTFSEHNTIWGGTSPECPTPWLRVCNNYRGNSLLSLLGKVLSTCLEKRCCGIIEPKLDDTQYRFRSSQQYRPNFHFQNKFSRNLGSTPKVSTNVLSTSWKHTTVFLEKNFGECCGRTVLTLTAACYWPSSHCIPVQKFVSVSADLNYNRSPWVFDSHRGACCHHSSSQSTWFR